MTEVTESVERKTTPRGGMAMFAKLPKMAPSEPKKSTRMNCCTSDVLPTLISVDQTPPAATCANTKALPPMMFGEFGIPPVVTTGGMTGPSGGIGFIGGMGLPIGGMVPMGGKGEPGMFG